MGSEDMEDIISVLEVSPKEMFEDKLFTVSSELQSYLKKELQYLLRKSAFVDAIHGAAFNRTNTTEAAHFIKDRIGKLVDPGSQKNF